MEEGEIVEEDGFGVGADAIEKKKSESDAESGEIKALEVCDISDIRNPVGSASPSLVFLALIAAWLFWKLGNIKIKLSFKNKSWLSNV